jgi:hypothetical protein
VPRDGTAIEDRTGTQGMGIALSGLSVCEVSVRTAMSCRDSSPSFAVGRRDTSQVIHGCHVEGHVGAGSDDCMGSARQMTRSLKTERPVNARLTMSSRESKPQRTTRTLVGQIGKPTRFSPPWLASVSWLPAHRSMRRDSRSHRASTSELQNGSELAASPGSGRCSVTADRTRPSQSQVTGTAAVLSMRRTSEANQNAGAIPATS